MKNGVGFAVAVALAAGVWADASFSTYDAVRKRVQDTSRVSGKVLECPHHIRWDGDDALVYATRSAKGEVSRRFTVSTSNLVDIARRELDEVWKRKQPEGVPRYPRNAGLVRPTGTYETKSPDGRWTAFCRDRNVWLKSKETGEFQLSFDGTQGNGYIDLMWSPDSKKLAALRERRVAKRQLTLVESSPADSVHPYVGRGFTTVRLGAVEAPSGRVRALAEESSKKFVFYTRIKSSTANSTTTSIRRPRSRWSTRSSRPTRTSSSSTCPAAATTSAATTSTLGSWTSSIAN